MCSKRFVCRSMPLEGKPRAKHEPPLGGAGGFVPTCWSGNPPFGGVLGGLSVPAISWLRLTFFCQSKPAMF